MDRLCIAPKWTVTIQPTFLETGHSFRHHVI